MLWISVIAIQIALFVSGLFAYGSYDREDLGGSYLYWLSFGILLIISVSLILSKRFYSEGLPFFLVFSSMIYLGSPIADEIFLAPFIFFSLVYRRNQNRERRLELSKSYSWRSIASLLKIYDSLLVFIIVYAFIGIHTFDPRLVKQFIFCFLLLFARFRIFDLTQVILSPSSRVLLKHALLIALATNIIHGALQIFINPITSFGSVDGVLGIQTMAMLFPVPIVLFFLGYSSKASSVHLDMGKDYAFKILVLMSVLCLAFMSDSRSALIYVFASLFIMFPIRFSYRFKLGKWVFTMLCIFTLLIFLYFAGIYLYNDSSFLFIWLFNLLQSATGAIFSSQNDSGSIVQFSYKGYSYLAQSGDYGRQIIALHAFLYWISNPLSLALGSGDYSYYEAAKSSLDSISTSLTGNSFFLPPGFSLYSLGPFYPRPPSIGTFIVERGYLFVLLSLYYFLSLFLAFKRFIPAVLMILLFALPVISSFIFNYNDLLIFFMLMSPVSFFSLNDI